MKKLLIFLAVIATFITVSAFISTEKTNAASTQMDPPPLMCQEAGNCSVNLVTTKDGGYRVIANNHNHYKVTVTWEAKGYDNNGKRRRVGSGTLSVEKQGKATSSTFHTKCEDVSLSNVYVEKCE